MYLSDRVKHTNPLLTKPSPKNTTQPWYKPLLQQEEPSKQPYEHRTLRAKNTTTASPTPRKNPETPANQPSISIPSVRANHPQPQTGLILATDRIPQKQIRLHHQTRPIQPPGRDIFLMILILSDAQVDSRCHLAFSIDLCGFVYFRALWRSRG